MNNQLINGVAPHVSFYFSLGTLSVASTALENRKWAVESPGCRGGNPFNQVHSGRQLFQRTFWDNRFFSEWHFQMWHVLIFQLVVINGQYWWRFLRVTIPRTKNRRQNTSCDKKKKKEKNLILLNYIRKRNELRMQVSAWVNLKTFMMSKWSLQYMI